MKHTFPKYDCPTSTGGSAFRTSFPARHWLARLALACWFPAVACAVAEPEAQPSGTKPADEVLVGLWTASHSYGPAVQGELLLQQQKDGWQAQIAGYRVAVTAQGGELTFELPGDVGKFRGRLQDGAIHGHWVQPPTANSNQRYASPVVLKPQGDKLREGGDKLWQGKVEPFDDQLRMYLHIARRDDGQLGAFLRNPERNVGVFLGLDRAELQGDQVSFLNREGEVAVTGDWRPDDERLSIFFPWLRTTYDFSRHEAPKVVGFHASADAQHSSYEPPLQLADGWPTAHANSVGLDSTILETWNRDILNSDIDSVYAPALQAVLVARRGRLVHEQYFFGFHRDLPHDTRSAGKSLAPTLVGLAVDDGALDASTRVYEVFPQDPAQTDERKAAMTVEHLMTMSAGFDCDDSDYDTPGNEDRVQSDGPNDWYRHTLGLSMVRQPGESGVYCSMGINLLGGILSAKTGHWLPDLFNQRLARPMGFGKYHINLEPGGNAYLGGGIRLRPRDLLKYGQLYLDGGMWQGKRLINEKWVERSFEAHSSLNGDDDYGFAWWRQTFDLEGREIETFYASGNGGQLLFVVPELELVTLFMGGNYGNYGTWRHFRDRDLPNYLLTPLVNAAKEATAAN